jgi:hypothetical protein
MKQIVAAVKIGLVAGVLAILGMSIVEPALQASEATCEGSGTTCHVKVNGETYHYKQID